MSDVKKCDNPACGLSFEPGLRDVGWFVLEVGPFNPTLTPSGRRLRERERILDFCSHKCLSEWVQNV
jgi:hypothetical protein